MVSRLMIASPCKMCPRVSSGSSVCKLINIDIDDLDILQWLIQLVHFYVLNSVRNLQPRQHTSKYRVFLVQPRCGGGCDEELRAVRAGPSIRHADCIWSAWGVQVCSRHR